MTTQQTLAEATPPFWQTVLSNIPFDAASIVAYVFAGVFFYTLWRNRS